MAPGRDRTRATLLGGECSHHCLIAASRRLLETTERMSQQERKYCPCSCFGMLKLFNETGSQLLLYQLTLVLLNFWWWLCKPQAGAYLTHPFISRVHGCGWQGVFNSALFLTLSQQDAVKNMINIIFFLDPSISNQWIYKHVVLLGGNTNRILRFELMAKCT